MSVKDLVQQFESSPSSPEGPRTPPRAPVRRQSALPGSAPSSSSSTPSPRTRTEPTPSPRTRTGPTPSPRIHTGPVPSPARFVHHPLLKRQSVPGRCPAGAALPSPPSVPEKSRSPIPSAPRPETEECDPPEGERGGVGDVARPPADGGVVPVVRAQARRESGGHVGRVGASPSAVRGDVFRATTRMPPSRIKEDPSATVVGDPVVSVSPRKPAARAALSRTQASPSRKEAGGPSTIRSLRRPSKMRSSQTLNDVPLNTFSRSTHDYDDFTTSRPPSPTDTLVSKAPPRPHVPVAAKTVFSRGSPPLSLPALDNYLSSLPPPTFSPFSSRGPTGKGKQPDATLFPPMDLLAATGHTIDDLEKNSTLPHWWESRGTVFKGLANMVIGVMGSSAISTYYNLQGLYDGLQLFALLLSTVVSRAGKDTEDKWRKIFLGIIPNILALNFGYVVADSYVIFVISMAVSGLLLYYFHVSTSRIALASSREGLQGKDTGAGWGIVFASFILTLFYLPLSTITVHALVWSDDFWVVRNPYTNTTVFPPNLPPLGPPSQFRDPLDFCYTTTMSKNEVNFAPVLVILAALTFVFLTMWFPIRLAMVIRGAVPRVDRYTELGKLRSKVELNHEYERLLDRDKNPFSFLYKDMRMGWGTYKSSYLFVKLSTLLIIAVLDSNNCLFRNASRTTVSIVREALLVVAMSSFLVVQSILTPFLDPVDNASEWMSRAGYVAFAVLGLTAAFNLPAGVKYALNGPILYVIYVINYGCTFYFLFIDLSWTHRLVKRLSRRIDFSIDIFSPHLDISTKSGHTRRRIWQESISALLLTTHECAIPASQKMEFSESQDYKWPPYLLDFQGSPAERHVENLKILREVGGLEYAKGLALRTGRHSHRLKRVQDVIQRYFVGPDSYWRTAARCATSDAGHFGNAWWIPFPPTLVMRYDSGELVVLNKLHELEEYLRQNEDVVVEEKRNIRMALRALDGLVVRWPYTHTQLVGARPSWCWGRRYTAQTSTRYESCVFSITRRGSLPWKGVQLGSGFDVRLTYTHDVHVGGAVIGLDDDFDLTPQLAQFLMWNRELIYDRFPRIDFAISDYRRRTRRAARAKGDTLSYEFMCSIYCSPKDPHHLVNVLVEQEKDLRVRQTFAEHEDALRAANERMASVHRSEASAWWYLYWDDLWRRNYETITALNTHASDFNPHYTTSIAYRPLPRAALETFLAQRGLFFKNGGPADFIHSGVLNKLYFRLHQIVFRGSEKAITYYLGDDAFEVDLEDLEFSSHANSSTLGTGAGTDHDDVSIRARPLYRWEAIYEDPLQSGEGRYKRWLPKLAVWFGLSPFWKWSTALTSGVSLDVQLEDGRYVFLENAVDELKEKVV